MSSDIYVIKDDVEYRRTDIAFFEIEESNSVAKRPIDKQYAEFHMTSFPMHSLGPWKRQTGLSCQEM